MNKEDVTVTEMDNGTLRVSLNTPEAKELAIDEPDFAPLVTRDKDFVYLDIRKTRANRMFVAKCCRRNKLTMKSE